MTDSVVVIIPTVRVDDWLSLAVHSALNQEGFRARVVVFHDGVEPDPRQDWMSDARVTALHSPVRVGLSSGLKRAIATTTESLIARLDADDLAEPNRFTSQLAFLRENAETVLLGSRARRIDEHGAETGALGHVIGNDVRRELLRRNVLIHSSVMFRRAAYDAAGGFDDSIGVSEDFDLWLRMGRLGPIAVQAAQLVSYRVHSRQMSRSAKPFGHDIRRIIASQRALARALRVSKLAAWADRTVWLGAQYLQYFGLRQLRYRK